MLRRLEKVQPVYRITDWIDDWQRSEELTQRITAYPAPSPTRSKSACRGTKTPGGLDQSEGGHKKVTVKEDPQGENMEIKETPTDSDKHLDTT